MMGDGEGEGVRGSYWFKEREMWVGGEREGKREGLLLGGKGGKNEERDKDKDVGWCMV